jgi:hypothetical protein
VIWRHPWAWLGLAAIALPVLIHLLGRGHAKVRPFPSLRFLERSRLLPTRRTRIHDWALLLVRAGILAAAVAALAQPWFVSEERGRTVGSTLVRAILVDTSASMRRLSGNESALTVARRDAQRLAGEARASLIVESNGLSRAIRGATDWLSTQPGTRELVIVSDFQRGTLDSADLSSVAADIGVKVARVAVSPATTPITTASRAATATTTWTNDRAEVAWSPQTAVVGDINLLTSDADRASASAAATAAATLGAPLPFDSARRVAVVFPSYDQRAALGTKRIDVPWMTSVAASVRADSLLASVSLRVAATVADTTGIVVARNSARRPVVIAAQSDTRLLFLTAAEPGSVTSAALIAAIDRARSAAPPLAELEPATIDDATLAAWQRAPSADARSNNANDSDGRWLWLVALVLLGVETWIRRERKHLPAAPEVAHARAA